MPAEGLPLLACLSAFWVGLLAHREERAPVRRAAGLVLGALLAQLGGALLGDVPVRGGAPVASVLLVPLGPWCAAPPGRAARRRFLARAWAALPAAFATARLGCVAVGCCPPAPGLEALGLLVLAAGLARARPEQRGAAALLGVGLLRLAGEPLRGSPPAAVALAAAWASLGALQLVRLRGIPASTGPDSTKPR